MPRIQVPLEAVVLVSQLKVSNPSNGVVVITPDPDKPRSYLRFEGHADPMGGDEKYISREAAQQPDFIRAVQRGLLKVELPEGDELAVVLASKRGGKKRGKPPLTVQNIEFEEGNDYKSKTTYVPVIIDPLAKV